MLQTRVRLDGLRMPTHWYDLCADLPLPLSPPLQPGTLQSVSPDDLASLFPMALTGPEVSTEREIPIPTPGPAQRPGRREEAHHRDRRPASGDRRCSSPAACSVGRARAPSPRRCAATPRAAARPSLKPLRPRPLRHECLPHLHGRQAGRPGPRRGGTGDGGIRLAVGACLTARAWWGRVPFRSDAAARRTRAARPGAPSRRRTSASRGDSPPDRPRAAGGARPSPRWRCRRC